MQQKNANQLAMQKYITNISLALVIIFVFTLLTVHVFLLNLNHKFHNFLIYKRFHLHESTEW